VLISILAEFGLIGNYRRKKTRCPGEKPVCSHCARLRQNCYYADEGSSAGNNIVDRVSIERTPAPAPVPAVHTRRLEPPQRLNNDVDLVGEIRKYRGRVMLTHGPQEDRLKNVEAQLAEVLANQASFSRSTSRHISGSPVVSNQDHGPRTPSSSRLSAR
jgi:hypothetical protein